jgi:hypothetical protein
MARGPACAHLASAPSADDELTDITTERHGSADVGLLQITASRAHDAIRLGAGERLQSASRPCRYWIAWEVVNGVPGATLSDSGGDHGTTPH